MALVTQFCVGLDNKPGELTRFCAALRTKNVNIEALFVSSDDEEDCAWLNFVATPPEPAEQALIDGGYKYFTEPVLAVPADNRPGEIEQIAGKLAEAGVNISYVYGSSRSGTKSTLVLSADDMAAAAKALGQA